MDTASPIRAALYRGDREEAERLASGADLDVFEAAALGDTAALRRLLEKDPSCAHEWSDDGFTALHFAAFLADAPTVRLLVDAGADVRAVARNEMRVQPLHSAAAHGDVDACRVLLEAGADVNAKQQGDFTPMDEAVLTNNAALVTLLEHHGALRQPM
jgi:uncharacterized protein